MSKLLRAENGLPTEKRRRVKSAARRSRFQALEQRTVLDSMAWIGGSGNWSDASHWQDTTSPGNHALPIAGDTATIDTGATTTAVTVQAGDNIAINNLITGANDTLVMSGGSFATNSGASVLSGPLSITGGSFSTSSSSLVTNNSTITVTGSGKLVLNSSFTNEGTVSAGSGGSIQASGQVTNDAASSVLSATGGSFNLSGPLANNGTLSASASGTFSALSVVGAAGQLSLSGSGSSLSLGGTGYIINDGAAAPSGTVLSLDGSWTNAVGSTISADGSTLNLGDQSSGSANEWSNAGTISGVHFATVNLGGAFTLDDVGSLSHDGASTVNLVGTLVLLPAAPTNLSATAGADFSVVNWSGSAQAVAGYSIERSTDGVHFNQIGTVAGNVDTYLDTGLNSGTTYSYRVRAYNSVGDSSYSNVASDTAGQLGPGMLVSYYASTDLSGAVATSHVVTTANDSWSTSQGPFGSARWRAQLTPQDSETYTFSASVNGSAKVWVNGQLVYDNFPGDAAPNPQIALTAGQKYNFEVDYESSSVGSGSAEVSWSSASTPNEIIPDTALSIPSQTGLDVGSNVAGPVVTQSGHSTLALDATSGDWSLAGGTILGGAYSASTGGKLDFTTNGGTLDGLTLNSDLYLAGNNSLATVVDGLTLNGVTVHLGDPNFSTEAALYFAGTQTLGGNGTVSFETTLFGNGLFESGNPGGTLTIGPNIAVRGTGTIGGTYAGDVIVNEGAISADDNTLQIRTPATAGPFWFDNQGTMSVTNVGGLSISGAWMNSGTITSSVGAKLSLGDQSSASTNEWTNTGTITATGASTVNLGGAFTLDDLGSFSTSSDSTINLIGTVELLPVAPVNVTATVGADFTILTWADSAAVVSGYSIERSTDGVNFSPIGSIAGSTTTYVDSGLSQNTTYYYRIRAYDAVGDSPYSSVASATTGQLGPGMLVSYYDTTNLSGPVATSHVAATAGDVWNSGPFGSARWLAELTPEHSETYTFSASVHGYAKVSVNGQVVYDNFTGDPAANPTIALVAGQKYDFQVEYVSNSTGSGNLQVSWSSPSTLTGMIPASALSMTTQTGLDIGANVAGPVVTPSGHSTLSLDATTGSWNLTGGTVMGGVYQANGGAELVFSSQGGTLDGLTAASDLNMTNSGGAQARITDGLTLANATLYLGAAGGGYYPLEFTGNQTLGGSGTVRFGNDANNFLNVIGALTIGPNVTVDGYEGQIQGTGNGGTLVNQGTIAADGAGGGAFGYDWGFGTDNNSFFVSTTDAIDTSGVTDPAPQEVYQTARQSNSSFTYTLTGLTPNAPYTVRLDFAEFQATTIGNRVFDVSVNNNAALTNFDIFAAAGGKDKAIDEDVTATADANGHIVITFSHVSGAEPQVNGIEVLSGATVVQAINAGSLGGFIGIDVGGFVNQGTLSATNGESLNVGGTWTNAAGATISSSGGGLGLGDQFTGSAGEWTNAGTITASNGSIVGLGGAFTVDDLGSFSASSDSTVQLVGALVLLPAAPTSLTATAGEDFTVLSWTSTQQAVAGFSIERSTDGVHFSQIGTVAGDATAYVDAGLSTNTNYYYRVLSYNGVGNSPYSNVAADTTGQLSPGMLVTYYGTTDLSGPVEYAEVDPLGAIDAWYSASWGSSLWLAELTPQYSETYTFSASYDGYAKVWVGGQLVFNSIDNDPANAQISLVAGQHYDLKVEYESYSVGSGSGQLSWSSPSTPNEVIPASALSMTTETGLNLGANLPGPVLLQTGHSTLSLGPTTGSWYLEGGAIIGGVYQATGGAELVVTDGGGTLDGVTANSNVDMTSYNSAGLHVVDGLTLNHATIALGNLSGTNAATLYFDNNEALAGTGNVLFNAGALEANGALTVGPNITIDGKSGTIEGAGSIENQGSIAADGAGGGNITVSASGGLTSFTNEGAISAINGNTLEIGGVWTNAAGGTITANAARLRLGDQGTGSTEEWTNAGTISATNASTVDLGGVFTMDDLGSFSRSSDTTVNLIGTLVLVPAAPTSLTATTGADFTLLSWSSTQQAVAGFSIERSTDGIHFSPIGTVAGSVTSYLDSGLNPITTYYYRVLAYNAVANSAYSSVATATTGQLGSGMLVSYYATTDLSGPVVTSQVDATASDSWSAQYGSARWLAEIVPQYSETYTFDPYFDGQAKVWVGGQIVYNTLDNDPANPDVAMVGGQSYDLKVEYQSYSVGYGSGDIYWSSTSTPYELVPTSALTMPAQSGLDLGSGLPGPTLSQTGHSTLSLDATTGSWNMDGGDIVGGTYQASGGAELVFSTRRGTLDGVAANSNLDLATNDGAYVDVIDGLTLNNATVYIGNAAGSTAGFLDFTGTETLGGTGTVLFGSNSGNVLQEDGTPPSTLTIGPFITIRGSSGTIYAISGDTIINQGTILADNSGGGSFGYDTSYSGGFTASTAAAIDTSGVTNPAPQEVYQTARQSFSSFSYTLTGLTPANNYNVRLDFADFQATAAGQRVFDVAINGTTVLSSFDIFAAAGGEFKALAEDFSNIAADVNGQITIVFTYDSGTYPAQVNGIELSDPVTINAGELPGGSFSINTTNFINEGTVSSSNGGSIGGISVINATGQVVATTEGSAAGGIVATFTDSNSSDTFNQPSINWGDGTSSDGTISGPDVNGIYTVTGTHTYAQGYVDAPLTVTISDTGGSTAVATGSISVADLPLHAGTATATSSTEDLTTSTLTATFSDDNLLSLTTDFSATINWGDGATSTNGYAIVGGNGSFTLTGSHVFADAGQRNFTITVNDQGGSSAVITGTATVSDVALTAGTATATAGTEGVSTSTLTATFTDANQLSSSGDFSASIDWGDHHIDTTGYSIVGGNGSFTLTASHVYAEDGTQNVAITVTDAEGQTAVVTGSLTIQDAALTAGALTPPVASEGSPLTSAVVFHFTDADPTAAAADFTATVATGDTTLTSAADPANVSIVPDMVNGGFNVLLSYTYAEELSGKTFSVAVTDTGGASTGTVKNTSFNVADAALTAGV
ncbi:MAG TPA: PA14 domain-containing protein, partial [Pirellulales bacterium]|nr:PA14 domain-containing protein [Pirellulales bacterium]